MGWKRWAALCLIGDTPDFGGLKNAAEFLTVVPMPVSFLAGGAGGTADAAVWAAAEKAAQGIQPRHADGIAPVHGLASGAELTIFDEPSLGLDAVMRERFYDEVVAAHRREPWRTFLISTHLIDEVARTLDYAVMIDGGRLLAQGSPEEMTRLYLCVSGSAEEVHAATAGLAVLREEEAAGTLVRYTRLNTPEDAERIRACGRVQTTPVSLQRLFVLLTEGKEAERDAG